MGWIIYIVSASALRTMTTNILSERLNLVPLTPAFLRAMLEHDLAGAGGILQVRLPDGLLDSTDVMALRLKQLEADPKFQPWSLRAIVLRERPVVVGHIGFHSAPGDEYLCPYAPGGVEFGFTVYPPFLRQGYAREASLALMHWAHQVQGVTRFVLCIRPDNIASQALAAGLGFVRVGSHLDDVDGLEDVLLHSLLQDTVA
jgi:ribosomal-protein-alanine N-acetyltransferase